jgi:hypothetical protein
MCMPICGKQRRLRGRGRGTGEANEFYVPEDGGRTGSPSSFYSVVAGRREERELALASVAAAAAASGSEVVAEGGGRDHPYPGGAADHAVVVHPGRGDRRCAGAAEEPVVEAASRGAVVPERAGGVVEVADLRRRVVVVVVRGAHGCEGRIRVGRAVAVAVTRRGERDGPRGEEVLGGGVGPPRAGGVAPPRAHPLHALEVEAVLLEVGGDVLPREAVDAHQLHYGLGHRVLDAQVRHRVHEALVQLRRPHQARPLQRPGRLVPGASSSHAAAARPGGRRRAGAGAVHIRPAGSPRAARAAATAAVRGDVEGDGEIGRDERLRDGHQLVRPGQLLLAAREPAGLLLLPHAVSFLPQVTAEQADKQAEGAIHSTTCVGAAEALVHSNTRSKKGDEGGVTSRWISLLSFPFPPFSLHSSLLCPLR